VDVRTSAGRSGVVLSPVGESVLRWSPDAAQFAVKIPVDVVRAQLSVLLRDAVETPPRFEPHLDLAVLGAGGIVPAARFLADQLGSGADLDERVREQAESFMLTQLLLGARHDYSERLESQAGAAGRLALDEAIDYIESFPDHVLGLAEVAAAAGTTASILRAAFEREMGTTVEAYVWGVRLSRVRAAVRAAGHGGVDVHSLGRRWRFRGPDHLRGVPGSVRRGPGPSQANRRRAGAAGRARRRRPQRTVGRSSPPGAKARGTRRRVGVKVIGTVA